MRRENGYTLVEMMIVIIIIGVLASIAIPSYSGILERTKKTACQANRRTIEIARAFNMINFDNYGASMADLDEAFTEIKFTGDSTKEDLVCPSGGVYTFTTGTFEVRCSIEAHNF